MKFLLILLIPFSLFSQDPQHADTLFLKSGKVYPCTISQIEEAYIVFKYGQGREVTIFLTAVDKIFLNPVGVVYTKETGYTKEFLPIKKSSEERDIKSITYGPNSIETSKNAQQYDWYLILSNGDIISQFVLQKVNKNFIAIYQKGKIKFISVESIIAMKRSAKSEFWESAGMGILAGTAAGILIQAPLSSGSGNLNIGLTPGEAVAMGGLAGFLIGGIVGANAGEDEIYDLTYMTPKRKLNKIREIISR